MSTLSRKPTGLTNDMDVFIDGAEKRTEQPIPPTIPQEFPWNAPSVRKDMVKTFNIRLPEPYHLKLTYIAEHTPYSMHNFCLDLLKNAIDTEVAQLTGKNPKK